MVSQHVQIHQDIEDVQEDAAEKWHGRHCGRSVEDSYYFSCHAINYIVNNYQSEMAKKRLQCTTTHRR